MIERVQYNAAPLITDAIKGTSQLKIYKELGFESLKFRKWVRHLCFLYKLRSMQIPTYLYYFILSGNCIYNTHNQDQVETYYCITDLFKILFLSIYYS